MSEGELVISKDEVKRLEQKNIKSEERVKEILKKIDAIENNEKQLRLELTKSLQKLTLQEKSNVGVENQSKLENIELLWRYEPSWLERKSIEEAVSLEKTHLPFTTTQAFIAFETLVEQLVIKDNYNNKYKTLEKQIDIIFSNNMLPFKYEEKFDSVRRARNFWFHAGKYPSIEVTEFLINMLHDANRTPVI